MWTVPAWGTAAPLATDFGAVREIPETRYATVGDADVAFQVFGEGPLDILCCWGMGTHVEVRWEYPPAVVISDRLASIGRVIVFDRRGTGASDHVARTDIPTWEEWAEDIDAVLTAAESERPAIVVEGDAGPIGILFAAMHPARVRALVLGNTTARFARDVDYPIGPSLEEIDALVDMGRDLWGNAGLVRAVFPKLAEDAEFVRWQTKLQRSSLTPRSAAAQLRYFLAGVDVRQALPLIRVPTLVLHYRQHPFIPVAQGRYLAEHIDGARLIELPGDNTQLGPTDIDVWFGEVAEFLTGERPADEVDRVLTTIVFTDIVDSTARASSVGDQRWRALLDSHDRAVRAQLRRANGREINTTGDGFVAAFDGPARAIRCAQAIVDAARTLGIDVRAGVHTGECELRGDDLAGLAVHIAARIAAMAGPREVMVSGTVKELVTGSGIEFVDRGEHQLKGVPAAWRLFAAQP